MSSNNRHYVSTVGATFILETHFGVEYTLDKLSMRWVHDYDTAEELWAAQDLVFELHSPHSGGSR